MRKDTWTSRIDRYGSLAHVVMEDFICENRSAIVRKLNKIFHSVDLAILESQTLAEILLEPDTDTDTDTYLEGI